MLYVAVCVREECCMCRCVQCQTSVTNFQSSNPTRNATGMTVFPCFLQCVRSSHKKPLYTSFSLSTDTHMIYIRILQKGSSSNIALVSAHAGMHLCVRAHTHTRTQTHTCTDRSTNSAYSCNFGCLLE